jgi:asparagine synthase (glutamine-hydrolysing)
MCGILGIVASEPDGLGQRVERGLDALSHRGPDARGVKTLTSSRTTCVLGHTRLRIVDLSPEADQPLCNEPGDVWVAYNGELYNPNELRYELERSGHRFRSNSDTEVLVHLYEDCAGEAARMLARLRGMFSFAIFDQHRDRLLLGRDRLGIKPMYVCTNAKRLAFSSEVRALAKAGFASQEPDPEAVGAYLTWGSIPGPRTVLADVRELDPGSYLEYKQGLWNIVRWWKPDVDTEEALAGDAERLVRAALKDSVSRHLVADRPVGVFLSGGVDSSAVASVAATEGRLRALTVTFPGTGEDEGKPAACIAERLGAAHEQVPVTGEEVADKLPQIMSAMDQPTADGVNSWIISKAAHDAGLVVTLSGLGGDELFGGYPSFSLMPRTAHARRLLAMAPSKVRQRAALRASHAAPGGRLARLLGSGLGDEGAYQAVRGLFAPVEVDGSNGSPAASNSSDIGYRPTDSGDRVMLLELHHYLSHQLLRDTDQMSMAHSLEVRVPLLDDSMLRVALALPSDVRNERGKALLARAARLEAAPKRPFALPFEPWMRGPLREHVRSGLLSEELPFSDLVPLDLRQRMWESFEQGRVHWSRLWAVTALRMWPQANGFGW